MRDAGLTIKTSKCTIAASEVELLGYTVNASGVRVQESKLDVIKNLSVPTCVKDIRSFLRMTGYYSTDEKYKDSTLDGSYC